MTLREKEACVSDLNVAAIRQRAEHAIESLKALAKIDPEFLTKPERVCLACVPALLAQLALQQTAMREALEQIVAIDLKKTDAGRDDFYSGPGCFFRAHAIAREALALPPAPSPKGETP